MKCINRFKLKFVILLALCIFVVTGCAKNEIAVPYGYLESNEHYNIDYSMSTKEVELFASDLCATDVDVVDTSDVDRSTFLAAGVFNMTSAETLYAYNVNNHVNPASITKIMTSLIVLENCEDLEQVVTVPDVVIYESGAQLFNIHEGDRITVKNLLYANLVYSGNDASLALAKYIAGTEADFCVLMNEKAAELGCTNTNFCNSNGLTVDNHYTSIYDLYLIFNEALKYDLFKEIINTSSVEISYTSAEGEYVTKSVNSTDKFLTGEYKLPDNITIIGGKTGSTNAAGKCLMICFTDEQGNYYVAAIMGAPDEQTLYTTMSELIGDTVN